MKGQRKTQDRLAAIDARVAAHNRRQKAVREDTRQQLAEAYSRGWDDALAATDTQAPTNPYERG